MLKIKNQTGSSLHSINKMTFKRENENTKYRRKSLSDYKS